MNPRLALLLFTLGIVTYLAWPTLEPAIVNEPQQEADLVPDFTATLLHQELFDGQGKIKREVFSQQMKHFSELALTYFEKPEFIIYKDEAPFWRLAAQHGSVQDGLLTLDKDVTMYQVENSELITTIETQYLEINLTSQLVWTDKPILIKGKNTTITGKGMSADLKAGKVSLVNHATTVIKGR